MSDQDVDAFLEHYGVKGMQWGVRNERSKEQIQRRDRRIKTVKKVAAVAGVAAIATGGIYANKLLKKHGADKRSRLEKVEHLRRLRDTGFAWKEGSKASWEYSLPLTPGPGALKWK